MNNKKVFFNAFFLFNLFYLLKQIIQLIKKIIFSLPDAKWIISQDEANE